MSTPRRRYQVDVTVTREGHHALIRRLPFALPWCWCRHVVRATSHARARAKAIAAHTASPPCQALDAQVRQVWGMIVDTPPQKES